jgi:hypothetical protein
MTRQRHPGHRGGGLGGSRRVDGRDSLFSAAAEALRGINRWFEDDANLDDLNHARDVLAAALGQELLASGFGDD